MIFLIAFLLALQSQAALFPGNFASNSAGTQNSGSFTSTASATYTLFALSRGVGVENIPLILKVQTAPTSSQKTRSYYDNRDPKITTEMDISGCNTGQTQRVLITTPTVGVITNFYVVQLSNTNAVAYSVEVTEINIVPNQVKCESPVATGYCSASCSNSKSGPYCSVSKVGMSSGNTFISSIPASGYSSYSIPGAQKYKIYAKVQQSDVVLYVQFKKFRGELAGALNYQSTPFYITSPGSFSVDVNANDNQVIVGIINPTASSATVSIWYEEASTTSILVIVLAVLGGVLLIALIIAVCYVVKRVRENNGAVHPANGSRIRRVDLNENKLNNNQMELYFPTVQFQKIFKKQIQFEPHSTDNLTLQEKSQQKDSVDKDCVICLEQIGDSSNVKVTYCKHFFHSHCLEEWFKKHQNCPYCRQQFSKSSTGELYKKLIANSGKKLKGLKLIQQICKQKNISVIKQKQDVQVQVQEIV